MHLQDLAWIKAGVYKMPWDMVTPNKQYNPLTVASRYVTRDATCNLAKLPCRLCGYSEQCSSVAHGVHRKTMRCVFTCARRTVNFWLDSARILGRSTRRQTESVWLQGDMYPQYYKTFHYQTDGWLSDT